MNYFETTIKYEKTAEEGKIVKVTEKYLVDALSFTEAEEIINREMQPFISGDFIVDKISRARINELFPNENGDKWFRAKVNFITLDEIKGVEKKTACKMLVQANDLKEAREHLELGMKGTMADYEVESLTETKIIDIFKYSDPVKESYDKIVKLLEENDATMTVS